MIEKELIYPTDDLRIDRLRPLIPPAILMEELPLSDQSAKLVWQARHEITEVLHGNDDRLVVIIGPCSIHDPKAGLEYAKLLKAAADQYDEDLLVAMRVYFEKPRTTTGWKGLINDPNLDGSFAINQGLRLSRRFLLDIIDIGLPAACEFLDPISPQFIADLVSWGAIGARTTESQVHRELASGLSMPVGFKNGTGGSVQIAIDAIRSAASPHRFLSVTKQGVAAIVKTKGNEDCHVILRGGSTGPNYSAEHTQKIAALLSKAGLREKLIVDCSHSNSGKNHAKQPEVAHHIAKQVSDGASHIMGVMLESFIKDGNQAHNTHDKLEYGLSITDACMSWERSLPVLDELAQAVRTRRKPKANP
ncbi:MAG: 3-deoxy-7-phosphoheptulonate synthase [Myxococcales bacterium]|nr:MAG: 3-deoxy-7-phosphoheptulonate synthase [Myxococcales bacterium]